jgi:hypothetical protein
MKRLRINKRSDECEIVEVGKRRDGGKRFWCMRHKADATAKYGRRAKICRAAHIPAIRARDILSLDLDKFKGGVALWGAVPAVYDTTRLPMDRGIHIHARRTPNAKKEMDFTCRAVRILSARLPKAGILVSEVDAIYYMVSSVFGFEMRHVICTFCGHPHLDRDWFSVHPHRQHLCAACGQYFRDAQTGVGNPIIGVRHACGIACQHPTVTSRKRLNIKQSAFPYGIQIWGSNPALLWTSKNSEEAGIHVHAFTEEDGEPEVDETYGEVVIDGVKLDPVMVRVMMAQSAMPSLSGRVQPIQCPSCGLSQFDRGADAFTPRGLRRCSHCNEMLTPRGKLRKVVSNPLLSVLKDLSRHAPRRPQQHSIDLLSESKRNATLR